MSKEFLMDLHNHSLWSDGINTTKEIIDNAIKLNINAIGITDHLQSTKGPSIQFSQIESYINELQALKIYYKNRIKILIGIEISVFPYPEYLNSIPYESLKELDYALLEYLENMNPEISLYDIETYLHKFPCRLGLAHTDLLKLANNHGGLANITEFLSENNIFWEINSNFMYEFFDDIIIKLNDNTLSLINLINKYKINVSVGSDTHDINDYEFGRLIESNRVAKALNPIVK